MADLPLAWWGTADFVKHDMMYMAGGIGGGSVSAEVTIYDPVSDGWSSGAALQDARFRLEGDSSLDSSYADGGWEPIWTPHASNEYLVQCPACDQMGWLEGYVYDDQQGFCFPVYQDAGPPDASDIDAAVPDDGTVTDDANGGSGIGEPCEDSAECTGTADYCAWNPMTLTGYCTFENCVDGSCPDLWMCCDCTPMGPIFCAPEDDPDIRNFCTCEPI